jgi:hypothetical protein
MSDSGDLVQCATHGQQPQAFLCRHIVQSLDTQQAIGFHWSSEDHGAHPDAWCNDCEDARVASGGDWTEPVLEQVGVTLVCGSCYQAAKSIWLKARAADGLGAP